MRTGDEAQQVWWRKAVSKTDPRIEPTAFDELNSFIGLMLSVMAGMDEEKENIRWIKRLFSIGGILPLTLRRSNCPKVVKLRPPMCSALKG